MPSVGRLVDITNYAFQFLLVIVIATTLGPYIKVEGERHGLRTQDPLAHEIDSIRCPRDLSSNPYVNCRPEKRVRPSDIPPSCADRSQIQRHYDSWRLDSTPVVPRR